MSYATIGALPDGIRHHLPFPAQRIYQKAFNSAFHLYFDEETMHQVAWAAVKKHYEKGSDGNWRKIKVTHKKEEV